MKFCDKLVNLRKKNNITQEILAEKVNVSRQAVSKWENGTSMPDMKTIMELCNILNCSLDELIDDKAIGNMKGKKEEKNNINDYLKEILDFITKTYNMFCSMNFKEKIKCLLEMSLLIIFLALIWLILGEIVKSFISPILWHFPDGISYFFHNLLDAVYFFTALIASFIVVIHLFKIRYLDYFVTIEDENVSEKTIEDVIPENEDEIIKENKRKIVFEKKKDRIIIRDPKHSSYNFLKALGNLIILFCKIIALGIGCFLIISFIFLSFAFFIGAFYSFKGLIFLGITIIILGLVLLNFLAIYLLYVFIFNQKLKKYLFICFMTTIILIAFGSAFTFIETTDFKYINDIKETKNTITKTTYIEVDNKTELSFLNDTNTKIIVDNKQNDAKIEITSLSDINVTLSYYQNHKGNDYFYINYYDDYIMDEFNTIIKMIKNHEWYSNLDLVGIKVYISEKNLEILKNNFNRE